MITPSFNRRYSEKWPPFNRIMTDPHPCSVESRTTMWSCSVWQTILYRPVLLCNQCTICVYIVFKTPLLHALQLIISTFHHLNSPGSVFECVVGMAVMVKYGWRAQVGITVVPCFLALLLLPFCDESARYYAISGEPFRVLRHSLFSLISTLHTVKHRPSSCPPALSEEGIPNARLKIYVCKSDLTTADAQKLWGHQRPDLAMATDTLILLRYFCVILVDYNAIDGIV